MSITPTPEHKTRPIALTIAGSDSSGGAGIQADLKTFSALGVYGASVITALTAQNTVGVQGVHPIPAAFVAAQLESVFADLDVAAAKTGMLATADIIAAVANAMTADRAVPLVVDPVMVATSGDALIDADAVDVLKRKLFPLATLVTPNLPEAAALTGQSLARNRADMSRQAYALRNMGCRAVLLKGGHGTGEEACDLLCDEDREAWLCRPRLETRNTHGTGCTLSAAIAAELAAGRPLGTPTSHAKDYLWAALDAARHMQIGRGHGPVDHLYAIPGASARKA